MEFEVQNVQSIICVVDACGILVITVDAAQECETRWIDRAASANLVLDGSERSCHHFHGADAKVETLGSLP